MTGSTGWDELAGRRGRSSELHIVTGAFGFTGKHIARRLLETGHSVMTLTGHPGRPDLFGGRIRVAPLRFDRSELVESLRGASVLYNTYWVRFGYDNVTFESAIRNTGILLEACEEAGLRRIVHISITNPSEDSPLPYFRGKAVVERRLRSSKLSYAILRPTVIFGPEDILINNIAWFLRRFPVFAVPGSGRYRVQPVFVGDLAELAVSAGGRAENMILDAAGPETYTFEELVRLIATKLGRTARLVHLRPQALLFLLRVVGFLLRDVVLTRDEIQGLMADLLVSRDPPTAPTRFSEWLEQNAQRLGTRYASELGRHYRGQ
ncbi:MAG: NAD-dependent epimerase/dehydratase family protein [Acidobacteriota bacterium]